MPLGQSPAVGVGPSGNYHHDKEHWRQQIAADGGLSPLARRIANLIEAKYISNKEGPKYFCAWPSIDTLRLAVKRADADVGKAIHELEARGHVKLQSQGRRNPRLIALVLKQSETIPVLSSPAPTAAPPDPGERRTDWESAAIETASVADAHSIATDPFLTAALAVGAAISLRPSSIARAQGTALLRPADVKSTNRAVTPEFGSEAH